MLHPAHHGPGHGLGITTLLDSVGQPRLRHGLVIILGRNRAGNDGDPGGFRREHWWFDHVGGGPEAVLARGACCGYGGAAGPDLMPWCFMKGMMGLLWIGVWFEFMSASAGELFLR